MAFAGSENVYLMPKYGICNAIRPSRPLDGLGRRDPAGRDAGQASGVGRNKNERGRFSRPRPNQGKGPSRPLPVRSLQRHGKPETLRRLALRKDGEFRLLQFQPCGRGRGQPHRFKVGHDCRLADSAEIPGGGRAIPVRHVEAERGGKRLPCAAPPQFGSFRLSTASMPKAMETASTSSRVDRHRAF